MRHGFTLVELAIVLVIIGLLVGGVLVGQDLIKSAQINAVVSDVQSYTAAALTFRDKYGGIPGDLRNDKAAQAGLTVSATSPGITGEGDGDGRLQCCGASNVGISAALGGENVLFWRHLSDAGLVAFTSTGTGAAIDTTNFSNTGTEISTLTPLLPVLRTNAAGFVHVTSASGLNYFGLARWSLTAGNASGSMSASPVLTAREALGIDQKFDDGFPAAGTVVSIAGSLSGATGTPQNGGDTPLHGNGPSSSNTVCFDNATRREVYAVSGGLADTVRCALGDPWRILPDNT
ncbi:MAG: prepilin-type N-terminal cleavage/methylation domain-containing protein [Alphaproteobacteria bacterium]